jgi:hypothetical protein
MNIGLDKLRSGIDMLEQEIMKNENRLSEAIKSADIRVLDTLLHDDLLFVLPNGQTITKQMDIDDYRLGYMVVSAIEVSERFISTYADTVVVSLIANLKAQYKGNNIDGLYRYLRIWKLSNNGYKVIAGSAVQMYN